MKLSTLFLESFEIPHILVNSASAFPDYGPLVEQSYIWWRGLKANILGTTTATQHFPLFRPKEMKAVV